MITINEFSLLTMQEKAEYTWQFGSFLLNKEYEDLSTRLYILDGFFVEVWIDYINLVHVKSFVKDSASMQKYLSEISLEKLAQTTSTDQ